MGQPSVNEAEQLLGSARTILLVDWPSPDVPDTLARARYDVYVKGGPEPDAFSIREMREGRPVARQLGRAEDARLVQGVAESAGLHAVADQDIADVARRVSEPS
jgi:hypothetical protein